MSDFPTTEWYRDSFTMINNIHSPAAYEYGEKLRNAKVILNPLDT